MTKYLKNSYLPDVRQVFDFMTIFPELSEKVSVVCVHPGPSVEVDPSFGAKEEANLVRLNLHTSQARKSENMKARISFMVSNSSFTASVWFYVIAVIRLEKSQIINNSDLSPEQH